MRIGYSFWGFLGNGVTDTPDGGRSHRRTLIDGLVSRGYEIVFLQINRDLAEAGDDLQGAYFWDEGLPWIDVLFLEWRWRIPGRNDTRCGSLGHSCDLHRQRDLVHHYTIGGLPTVLWDKDQQLLPGDPLRGEPNVMVCEPALHPSMGAVSLLFPVADETLDATDPAELAAAPRDLPLVYVGNQYDRDDAFDAYFAPAAARVRHAVARKWVRTQRWPHVRFTGRVSFREVARLHRRSLATMLLAPHRYAARGQFTQRIFEATLAGCLPLGPSTLRAVETLLPAELVIEGGDHAADIIHAMRGIAGTPTHADLIDRTLRGLDVFRLSRQLATLTAVLETATSSPTTPP